MIATNRPVSQMSDTDLIETWVWIDTQRVKSGPNKGIVKLSAARLGDRILKEASCRNLHLPN
jgi:hypothetical protein